jgi:pyruvate kinase
VPRTPAPHRSEFARIRAMIRKLEDIRAHMAALAEELAPHLGQLDPTWRASARNLIHYVAFRRHDVRAVQKQLAALGLSSLGRSEAATLANLNLVLRALHRLGGLPEENGRPRAPVQPAGGRHALQRHTQALLGPEPPGRFVRIMVTLPSEAAEDARLVRDMLAAGMDLARINCAHDGPAAWQRMLANLRRGARATGRRCRVLMDLAGPKLRTGPLRAGPQVIKWRPRRDAYGRVIAPASVLLLPPDAAEPEAPHDALLRFSRRWLEELAPGEELRFLDARGAPRCLEVEAPLGQGFRCRSSRTCYVTRDTSFRVVGRGRAARLVAAGLQGELPAAQSALHLSLGDHLALTRALEPGQPARRGPGGRELSPATIGCTLPEVFAAARPGQAVWLDDGKIGGVIREVGPERLLVEVTHARPGGEKLGPEKGINLPDTRLAVPALTDKDRRDLAFAVEHADLVALSFARGEADVRALQAAVAALGGRRPGLVVKIETRQAFERLPEILLAAMRGRAAGMMIARGDLAVECGYERLAEVQEEILWVCEAAHVPVFWATQVLESLAKHGLPSRAEITDAAMGERAECVMLNKGPHVVETIRVLDNIIRRMASHQHKKRSLLRRLRWWARIRQHVAEVGARLEGRPRRIKPPAGS